MLPKYNANDLFKKGTPVYLNACVGRNGGPYDFRDYSYGYFEAARAIVKAAIDHELAIDLSVYPITYNYRHAIELGLKHLANILPTLWNEQIVWRATHKLSELWELLLPYLRRDGSFNHVNEIEYVEKILNDIEQFDPNAEVFRFPTDRGGMFYLQETAHINLIVLSEAMETVKNIFEAWYNRIETIRDTNNA